LGLNKVPSSGAVCGLWGTFFCGRRGFGFGGVGGRTGLFTAGSGGGGRVDSRIFFGPLLGIRDFGDACVGGWPVGALGVLGVLGVLGGVFMLRSDVSR
jgi:hypothetical protein